jgi:hypothetical protein
MGQSPSAERWSTKRGEGGLGGRGNKCIDKIYTLAFRARAGSTKHISFFIRLIGFKGLS